MIKELLEKANDMDKPTRKKIDFLKRIHNKHNLIKKNIRLIKKGI